MQVSALTTLTRLTQLQLVYTARRESLQAVGGVDRTLDQAGVLAHMTWLQHLVIVDNSDECGDNDPRPHLADPSLLDALPAWIGGWGPGLSELVLTGMDLDEMGTAAMLQSCRGLIR